MKTIKPFNLQIGSFLKGFSSAFDITGQTLIDIPDYKAGFQRDTEAIRGDWAAIGNDLRLSMNTVAHEQ
jgi:hypothetical protein